MSYSKFDNSMKHYTTHGTNRVRTRNKYELSYEFTKINTSSLGTIGVGLEVIGNTLYIATRENVWQYISGSYFTKLDSVTGIDISNVIYSIGTWNGELAVGLDHNNLADALFAYNNSGQWDDPSGGADIGVGDPKATAIFQDPTNAANMYLGTKGADSGIGEIYKYVNVGATYTKIGVLTGSTQIDRISTYNGNIVAGITKASTNNGYVYYRSADNDWPILGSLTASSNHIYDLIPYRRELYLACDRITVDANNNPLYHYDGSAWQSFSMRSNPFCFNEYNDRLYMFNFYYVGASGVNENEFYSETVTNLQYKRESNITTSTTNAIISIKRLGDIFYGMDSVGNLYKSELK